MEKIFKTKLLAGLENRRQPHYSIKHTLMAATGARDCVFFWWGAWFSFGLEGRTLRLYCKRDPLERKMIVERRAGIRFRLLLEAR